MSDTKQELGMIFPGQGSQKLGMLAGLAAAHTPFRDTFTEASDALGQDLWDICQHDSENTLDRTEITQPVLLTASMAIWRTWRQLEAPLPATMAGHSLGEYSALACAGVIDFVAAVKLVHQRGKLMQQAVPAGSGKMAAIVGLENLQIDEICDEAEELGVVSAANFNSPGQTVIAGATAAVDLAIELCKEAGARRALPLNVSIPSHCDLMRPAAEQLETLLTETVFRPPQVAVVQNVNAEASPDPDQIKANLVRQLYSPVQWVSCVNTMHQSGVRQLVECGPGKVLCGLIKRIEPAIECFGSEDAASLDNAIAAARA